MFCLLAYWFIREIHLSCLFVLLLILSCTSFGYILVLQEIFWLWVLVTTFASNYARIQSNSLARVLKTSTKSVKVCRVDRRPLASEDEKKSRKNFFCVVICIHLWVNQTIHHYFVDRFFLWMLLGMLIEMTCRTLRFFIFVLCISRAFRVFRSLSHMLKISYYGFEYIDEIIISWPILIIIKGRWTLLTKM